MKPWAKMRQRSGKAEKRRTLVAKQRFSDFKSFVGEVYIRSMKFTTRGTDRASVFRVTLLKVKVRHDNTSH